MDLQQRVARLEDDLSYLRAIVDGGETQAREAIVVTIGVLASFAAKSMGLDLARLVEFISDEADPAPAPDDRTAMLLHGVRLILTYHREREVGSEPSPVTALTATERQDVLRRAKASVDFERDARDARRDASGIPDPGGGSSGSSH